jgi:hypothetical protein
MLEEAAQTTGGGSQFDTNAASFQSQAATARNIGSWCATIVGFIFFLYRYFHVTGEQLSDFVVNLILVTYRIAQCVRRGLCMALWGGISTFLYTTGYCSTTNGRW